MALDPSLTRVLVSHPNPLLATAISSALELAGPLTAQACSGDLLKGLTGFRPDILMLDPRHLLQRLEALLTELTQCLPRCQVLAYIAPDDQNAAMRCLAAGSVGVVSQRQGVEAIVEAVSVARLGGIYVDESFAPALSSSVMLEPVARAEPTVVLCEREQYVLEHVARGLSNKEIAQRIGLSPKTVETHRARAMTKLGLRHTSDIVQHALRSHWLAREALAA